MRSIVLAAALAGALVPLAAQPGRRAQPVGLVLGNGATLSRAKAPAAAARPGEVLFAGDTLRAGAAPVAFLFCPEKISATLAAHAEATLTANAIQSKTADLAARQPVGSCFLPEVQQLSVASQQHFGVMMARAGSTPPPATTLAQRLAALSEAQRAELRPLLEAQNPDAATLILRAAACERAGLLYDAGEAYRAAAALWPGLAWLQLKVNDIENRLLRQQP